MTNSYDQGTRVRLSVTLRDAAGAVADPDGITCRVRSPSGVITSLSVVRTGVGLYYAEVVADADGYWNARWETTGTNQAAVEQRFHVKPSAFA